MSKVFRLHDDGGTINDWSSTQPYGPGVINSIGDPNKDNDNINITSIPSPFARIELYKTAYEKVLAGELSGNSTYHKLVSQSLDVFQLFFNLDQIKNVCNVEISNWSYSNDFQELNNNHPENKLLYDTLSMYHEADSQSHRLGDTNNLFFLKMNKILVGSTSPNVLFMASPDIHIFKDQIPNINLQQNHSLFSDTHLPLYKRQKYFIKYYIDFFADIQARDLFPLCYKYLEQNLLKLQQEDNNLYQKIHTIEIQDNLDIINDPSGKDIIPVTIANITLKKINQSGIANSDFFIKSDKSDDLTVIIPSEHNGLNPEDGSDLVFFNDMPWDPENNGKNHDYTIIYSKRVLPGLQSQQAWLGKDDFFEDHLVELPFNPDSENFILLNLKDDKSRCFLSPIKPIYNKFFNQNTLSQAIEIIETGNNITISINIPTTGAGIIHLSKQYSETKNETNLTPVRSRILSKNFSIGIQNNFKFDNEINKQKTIIYFNAIENNTVGIKSINYYNDNGSQILNNEIILDREKKYDKNVPENYLQLEIETHSVSKFLFIELVFDGFSTYILPKFIDYQSGNNDFEVAIDFGTSNSYIAIKNSQTNNIEGLKLDQTKPLTIFLHKDFKMSKENEFAILPMIINRVFMPTYLTGENDRSINDIPTTKLPFKSELLEKDNLDWTQSDFISGGDVSINYSNSNIYEVGIRNSYYLTELNISSNFKWFSGRSPKGKKQVEIYLNHIFIFIKHFLMTNSANLNNVKLTYTFPLSMSQGKLNQLKNIFAQQISTNFNINEPHNHIKGISESISPYYYYKYQNGLYAFDRPIYNIDIGGGTIDIVTYKGNDVLNQQSLRFGANELFNYSDMPFSIDNREEFGILNWAINKGISEGHNAQNGLKAIEILLEQKDGQFEKAMLDTDHPFKFYFLTYFSAIFYYILKFNKISEWEDIKAITFSGSGSKLLRFLDNTHDYSTTLDYFNAFAQELVNQEQPLSDIKIHSNPKLITAEGALCVDWDYTFQMSEENDKFWLGIEGNILVSLNQNIITEDFMYEPTDDTKDFQSHSTELANLFSIIFKVLSANEFTDKFYIRNIDKIADFITNLQPDFSNMYVHGVSIKKGIIGEDERKRIDESLFFAAFPDLFKNLGTALLDIDLKSKSDE